MNSRRHLKFFLASLLFIIPYYAQASNGFPVSQKIAEQVWFWEGIFSKFDSNTMIIHDTFYPQIIVDVVNFEIFAKKFNHGQKYSRQKKSTIIKKYIKRYNIALSQFRRAGKKAKDFGPMESRVYEVYSKNPKALHLLLSGKASIRSQTGLSDEFDRAAIRAKKFLPYIEKIFQKEKLPLDLTRLAFVESMFNTRAKSKVGASGIWQFMPRTAKSYMTVSNRIDERNSPIKASKAASRYLSQIYRNLKSWPLAVTAYNHGTGGIRRAIRKTGSRNLETIIHKYRSNSFGFASRNFYSEFIAARNVYNRKYRTKTVFEKNPLGIGQIKLNRRMSLNQLIRHTPLTQETISYFNPCLLPKAFHKRYSKYKLPKNYELFVPKEIMREVSVALKRISPNRTRRFNL